MMFWILKIIFWFSLVAIFYIYVGYPICVLCIARFRYQPVKREKIHPPVTILIAAFNEEECIAATIENKLALKYPIDKLEIIVISDESQDSTEAIVKSFSNKGVRLLRQSPRAGKTSALNLAVPFAHGKIIVFSDANSIYDYDALQELISNFADCEVGYVTGKMIYTQPGGILVGDGCSAYMKYENMIRTLETRCGSIVGVDGGIDAVRKNLYQPMNADQLPDFLLPLKVVEKGYRVVYEPEAILKEPSLVSSQDEYRMRVRVSLRAMWALFDMRHLLSFKRYPLFTFQLWSHKVLRYLCFVFFTTAFVINILLLFQGAIYILLFILQVLSITCAIIYPYLESKKWDLPPFRILNFFFLINVACAHAFTKFIRGKKQVLWSPRKG